MPRSGRGGAAHRHPAGTPGPDARSGGAAVASGDRGLHQRAEIRRRLGPRAQPWVRVSFGRRSRNRRCWRSRIGRRTTEAEGTGLGSQLIEAFAAQFGGTANRKCPGIAFTLFRLHFKVGRSTGAAIRRAAAGNRADLGRSDQGRSINQARCRDCLPHRALAAPNAPAAASSRLISAPSRTENPPLKNHHQQATTAPIEP